MKHRLRTLLSVTVATVVAAGTLVLGGGAAYAQDPGSCSKSTGSTGEGLPIRATCSSTADTTTWVVTDLCSYPFSFPPTIYRVYGNQVAGNGTSTAWCNPGDAPSVRNSDIQIIILSAAAPSITASPSTVVIPAGQVMGTTTVSFSSTNASGTCIWISQTGEAPRLWSCNGAAGSGLVWPYVPVGGYTKFLLTTSSTAPSPVLATTTATGVTPTGTVTASPSTVVIPAGQTAGTTTVSFTSTYTNGTCIWISQTGEAPRLWSCGGAAGSGLVWPYVPVGGYTKFLLTTSSTAPSPVLATTTATGVTPPPDGPAGTIVSAYSNKCVDVAGGLTANGTHVQLYDCNGTASQRWTVTAAHTLSAFGKCMDVSGGVTANGTKVWLYDCNGTGAQVWMPQADGTLLNPMSGRCLDDPYGVTTNGTQLDIWDCVAGATNEKWSVPHS
ncbi:ricin-type beta-trefoil lectin domain protein [Longispora fulva]|uniref:Ricin B lectin domain-containing protein n=1 Tax=Longispora fulva TaxID=619741 RepID=A0A8J7G989_9ACTN|nr:ricin-type beta-trefoil lectin domain protein [Longispora fulva]MBG6136083.1 hypothetical protein [Longispora fulva]